MRVNGAVLHGLLNFGSGFRKDLHKLTDRVRLLRRSPICPTRSLGLTRVRGDSMTDYREHTRRLCVSAMVALSLHHRMTKALTRLRASDLLQLYGLIGMYISTPKLDGKFMSALTIDSVANYFSLPLERDEELSPGIYIAKPVRTRTRCSPATIEQYH